MTNVGTFNIGFETDVATLINGMNRAANAVTQGSGRIQKSLATAERSVTNLVKGFAGLLTVRGIQSSSDGFTQMANRLRVVSKSQQEFQASLAGVARETFGTVGDTAALYSRLSIATKDLGATQADVLKITQALGQTFRISGASAQETAAASMQLAQGLASGRLQGDELRSVLENNAILGQLLAKELKTNVGALRDMAAQGKVTADVVGNILLKNLNELNAQAAKIAPTFAVAFQVVRDQFSLGFGTKTNEDLQGLATGLAGSSGRAYEFGLLIGDVVNRVVQFGGEIGKVAGFLADLTGGWNTFGFAVQSVMNSIQIAVLTAQAVILKVTEAIYGMIDSVRQLLSGFTTGIGGLYVEAAKYTGFISEDVAKFAQMEFATPDEAGLTALRAGFEAVGKEINGVIAAQDKLEKDTLAGNSFKGLSKGLEPFGPPAPEGTGGGLKPPPGLGDGSEVKKIKDVIEQLKFRNEQIGRGAQEQELYNQLRAAGVSLESQAGQQIKALLEQQSQLQQAQRVIAEERNHYTEQAIKLADDYSDKLERQAETFKQLDDVIEKGIRGQIKSWRDLGQVAVEALQNIIVEQIRAQATANGSGSIAGSLIKGLGGFFGFGGGGGNLKAVSNPNIAGTSYLLPKFAKGGITSGPSLAGEAGPEAVVPLPNGRSIPVDFGSNGGGGIKIGYIDMRGASMEAVAELHRMLTDLKIQMPRMSTAAVQNQFNRNPSFIR